MITRAETRHDEEDINSNTTNLENEDESSGAEAEVDCEDGQQGRAGARREEREEQMQGDRVRSPSSRPKGFARDLTDPRRLRLPESRLREKAAHGG